jgi:hypothetical protein
MQSHVQRRRQHNIFRPRQTKNDVNAGALASPAPADEIQPAPLAQGEPTASEALRRCAERDLL